MPVTGRTVGPVQEGGADQGGALRRICEILLGVVPPDGELVGARICMRFLEGEMFRQLSTAVDDHIVACHAHAHMLRLICRTLFCDLAGSYAHFMFLPLLAERAKIRQYSWGSAMLAWLYQEMCRATDVFHSQIGGALHLL
ncbi:serine/threonine-protein phosphatase 7 long form homolog [Malania oleifera]|uniref:serine/threonine-protein phosphatase 7 long form homolog n=1 Tax=Malania oleifera TaxID=397392 RepID=UPI0025ADE4C6|nr:serine/threonine-protein phosphatase 7 long form homolog [Malania oleifera]